MYLQYHTITRHLATSAYFYQSIVEISALLWFSDAGTLFAQVRWAHG